MCKILHALITIPEQLFYVYNKYKGLKISTFYKVVFRLIYNLIFNLVKFSYVFCRVFDTTIFEIIPRCSPSYLQFIVEDISEFASSWGMRLNPKKCKELEINFLKYQPVSLQPLRLGGTTVQCEKHYK